MSWYRTTKLFKKVKQGIVQRSRDAKLEQFYAQYRHGMTVLDAGVSSEMNGTYLSARNHFLKTFRYESKYYTGLGVQNLAGMEELYPGKRFIQYAGGRFPFGEKEFDWIFSNAVIEHVGRYPRQLEFINEMLRVGRNVFFTTPNRYFPVESHADVLFLHWFDDVFYRYCRSRRPSITPETLCLLSKGRLRRLLADSNARQYRIHENRFLGMTMTFSVMCSE